MSDTDQDIRDRLIRIETLVEQNNRSFSDYKLWVGIELDKASQSASRAHERIDCVTTAQTRFIGWSAGVAFISALVVFILRLTGTL